MALHDALTGRCDERINENIVSPNLAERTILREIVKMTAIRPVKLIEAFMACAEPEYFTFSRS